jgi:hypothetical protein
MPRRKAGSDGSPDTPTVRPSSSRGRVMPGRAIRGRERAPDERAERDEVGALRARERQVVDVQHAGIDPPGGDELERVRPRAGLANLQPDPRIAVAASRTAA